MTTTVALACLVILTFHNMGIGSSACGSYEFLHQQAL